MITEKIFQGSLKPAYTPQQKSVCFPTAKLSGGTTDRSQKDTSVSLRATLQLKNIFLERILK